MRIQICSLASGILIIFLMMYVSGCASPAYEKAPDFVQAKARVETARNAYEAAEEELEALRAKKQAEEAQAKAEVELQAAREKTKSMTEKKSEENTVQ